MIASTTQGVQVFPDMPASEYHRRPELSRGAIHTICTRGLMAYRHSTTEPRTPTEAMDFGTVCHSILFGNPDKELLIYKGTDRRTKAGKDEWAAVQDTAWNEARLPVKEAVYAEAVNVVEAVLNDPDAGPILKLPAYRELTVVWHDEEIGHPCRCRFDFLPENATQPIIDLKVVSALPKSPQKWAYTAQDFGYDVQDCHYTAGAVAAGFGLRDFLFLLVESSPPYETAVFQLDRADVLTRCSPMRKQAVRELITAQIEGVYPKRYWGVQKIRLPFAGEGWADE